VQELASRIQFESKHYCCLLLKKLSSTKKIRGENALNYAILQASYKYQLLHAKNVAKGGSNKTSARIKICRHKGSNSCKFQKIVITTGDFEK
jgi:hypothetical protein